MTQHCPATATQPKRPTEDAYSLFRLGKTTMLKGLSRKKTTKQARFVFRWRTHPAPLRCLLHPQACGLSVNAYIRAHVTFKQLISPHYPFNS